MYKRIDVKGMPVRNCLIHGLIGAVQPLQKCVHVRSDTLLSQLKQRVEPSVTETARN